MPNIGWRIVYTLRGTGVQRVTNNIPGIGSDMKFDLTGMTSYNDDNKSDVYKWYYSRSVMNKHITSAGWSINFVDAPRRTISFGSTTAYWSAQLYLINNGNPVLRISYGFTLDFVSGLRPIPYSYYIYPQYKK
jgi:hypothetical protein